jgi:hypothetical protein
MPMNMSALSPDLNKQLTNEQQKEIGRQIVQTIRAALRLGDPIEAQILRAMVELNFYPTSSWVKSVSNLPTTMDEMSSIHHHTMQ